MWVLGVILAGVAWAQSSTPAASRTAMLDETLRMGTIAALAPLCRMRDEDWAFDLRRAMVMEATRSPSPQDSALRAAPGRQQAESALSFAEAEALESFAEAPAAMTCEPLAHDQALTSADRKVAAFRILRGAAKPGS